MTRTGIRLLVLPLLTLAFATCAGKKSSGGGGSGGESGGEGGESGGEGGSSGGEGGSSGGIECNGAVEFTKMTGTPVKYLDDGSEPGPDWAKATFSDAAWSTGEMSVGYSDDYTTQVSPNMLAYFIRAKFTVSGASTFKNLVAEFQCDDGCVVYVNGKELFRTNMPEGDVDASTPATGNILSDEATIMNQGPFKASDWALKDGENLLAISVHNWGQNSSDSGTGFSLKGCK